MPTLPPTLPRALTHDTLAAGTGAGAACLCPSLPRPRGSAGERSRSTPLLRVPGCCSAGDAREPTQGPPASLPQHREAPGSFGKLGNRGDPAVKWGLFLGHPEKPLARRERPQSEWWGPSGGAVQDGQAGKKTRCGCCAPPATARRCGQAPKCRIASAQPGTETGSRQAGVCGTARTGSGHPGSPAGPSAVTSQSRQTPAMRHIRARNKKFWVSVCSEMEFNSGARVKEALSPQGRHQRPA